MSENAEPRKPCDSLGIQAIPLASEATESVEGANLIATARKVARDHPLTIGPHKILSQLGEGGMGIVYLAEQVKPIHRRVALKVVKPGMDSRQVISRFETEREALALMNHPHVAKVFDAGTTEQGRPYFVMEYVPGISITQYCDKHRLNTEERLHLFMDVCNAVQHAHQKGIIHRDIKPSNVLVSVDASASPEPRGLSPRDAAAAGRPAAQIKVIDFGVAKATQHRLTERTLFTEQGQLIGTPGYMSPEQAEMTALDIDTRTDIYSLGVLLYELLTGELPFDSKALREAGLAEIQRIIREVDPPKPSTKLSSLSTEPRALARANARSDGPTELRDIARADARGSLAAIAHHRRTEPKTLIRQIRGDLDWIVMKCLEKDRTRRYDTANGLALELQRYLNNEPVLAGPPGFQYRARKFVRKHRLGFCFALLFVSGLVAFATLGLFQWAWGAKSTSMGSAFAHFAQNYMTTAAQRLGPDASLRDVINIATREFEKRPIPARPAVKAEVHWNLHFFCLRVFHEMDQAEYHLRRALLLLQSDISNPDDLMMRAIYRQALTKFLKNQRRFDESEQLYLVTMTEYRRWGWAYRWFYPEFVDGFGESLIRAGISLASAAIKSGELEKAAELSRRVQAACPSDTTGAIQRAQTNALRLYANGDGASVEAMFQQTIDSLRASQGDTVELINGISEIALLLHTHENFPAEERFQRAAIMLRREILGDQDLSVAICLDDLATCLAYQGRFAEALYNYEEALAMRQRHLAGDHSHVVCSLNKVGACLLDLDRAAEALDRYKEALAMSRRLHPFDHWNVAASLIAVGTALESLDRSVDALSFFEEGLSMLSRLAPTEQNIIRIAAVGKGRALISLKRYDDAEQTLLPAWEAISGQKDVRMFTKVMCLEGISQLYEAREATEPGRGHAERAAEWRAKLEKMSKSQNVGTSKPNDLAVEPQDDPVEPVP